MKLDYFVLRLESEGRPMGDRMAVPGIGLGLEARDHRLRNIGPAASGSSAFGIGPMRAVTEVASFSEREALDLAQDPANTVSPVMPVSLIEPCASQDFGIPLEPDPVAVARASRLSWGIAEVGADRSPFTGAPVKVAILDTGIASTHPCFQGVNIVARNFTDEGKADDVTDHNGHGTHCAGTVLGRDVGGVRIGVARGVQTAIIGKVLDREGRGTTDWILDGLKWALEQGAQIVSVSIGFDFARMQEQLVGQKVPAKVATSMALKAYRENIRQFERLGSFLMLEGSDKPGAVVVAAAGNDSRRDQNLEFLIDTSPPAVASPDFISVGATRRLGDGAAIASFSNVNPTLCAPGVDIVSADRSNDLKAMNGTSMACPHVAGLAALWWEFAAKNVGKAAGSIVRAQLLASARQSGFVATTAISDRGVGCAMAPR